MKPDGMLLEQTAEVKRFFDRAVSAAGAMVDSQAGTTQHTGAHSRRVAR